MVERDIQVFSHSLNHFPKVLWTGAEGMRAAVEQIHADGISYLPTRFRLQNKINATARDRDASRLDFIGMLEQSYFDPSGHAPSMRRKLSRVAQRLVLHTQTGSLPKLEAAQLAAGHGRMPANLYVEAAPKGGYTDENAPFDRMFQMAPDLAQHAGLDGPTTLQDMLGYAQSRGIEKTSIDPLHLLRLSQGGTSWLDVTPDSLGEIVADGRVGAIGISLTRNDLRPASEAAALSKTFSDVITSEQFDSMDLGPQGELLSALRDAWPAGEVMNVVVKAPHERPQKIARAVLNMRHFLND